MSPSGGQRGEIEPVVLGHVERVRNRGGEGSRSQPNVKTPKEEPVLTPSLTTLLPSDPAIESTSVNGTVSRNHANVAKMVGGRITIL